MSSKQKKHKAEKISTKLTFNNLNKAREKNENKAINKENYSIRIYTLKSVQNSFKELYFKFIQETGNYDLKEYQFFRILLLFIIENEKIKEADKKILKFVFRRGRRANTSGKEEPSTYINFGNYSDNTIDVFHKVITFFAGSEMQNMEFFSSSYFLKIIIDYSEKNINKILKSQKK